MLNFVHFLHALIVVFIGILGCFKTAPAVACTSDEITLSDNSCVPAKFSMTVNIPKKNTNFFFYIAAKGTFYVDWGNGDVESINSSSTTREQHSKRYKSDGNFVVRIGGLATEYNTTTTYAGASFSVYSAGSSNMKYVTKIEGSLGSIFPTIDGGNTTATQPHFNSAFRGCQNLVNNIPSTLFSGISGPATVSMFEYAFYGTAFTGYIPYNLFSGITGTPTNMMYYVFNNNSTLATTCPTGTTQFITGYESSWNSKVACKPDEVSCDHAYNGACPDLCSFATELKTSSGLSFPLFATKETAVAINIRQNGVTCYVPLESGNGGSGSLNIAYNNTIYHAGILDN